MRFPGPGDDGGDDNSNAHTSSGDSEGATTHQFSAGLEREIWTS